VQFTSLEATSFYLEAPELVAHAYSQIICRVYAAESGANSLIVEDGRGNRRSILNELAVDVKAYLQADI
jgi:hypothetical protein